VLAGNDSYPAITLTVNVAPTAPAMTNTATVAVSGESNTANNAASDLVQIGTAFPLKLSTNHRYLVDQNNRPVPILGRTAWFVISVSAADYHIFVDDTAARGYNAIEMHVLDHDSRGNHPPLNGNLDAPFLKRPMAQLERRAGRYWHRRRRLHHAQRSVLELRRRVPELPSIAGGSRSSCSRPTQVFKAVSRAG
jgi:hypothetical protein